MAREQVSQANIICKEVDNTALYQKNHFNLGYLVHQIIDGILFLRFNWSYSEW